jgi:hypothetical protein
VTELNEQQKTFLVLRRQLRHTCDTARRDAVIYAILVVVLSPVAVVIFLLTLLFALALVDLPFVDYLGYRVSFITGVNLCLAFMGSSYFLRPKAQYQQKPSDGFWLLTAGCLFCIILALSYFTTLAANHPAWFWSLYLMLALVMLGCIGHAYEPHDDYYLGWTAGPLLMDDPFTIRDDIDRALIGLGFLVFISQLILESYGAIFGNRWLWRGMQESELAVSAALLQGLAVQDASGAISRIQGMSKESAADVVRALVKLDLVVIEKGRPKLSRKGREFLELKAL